MFTWIKEIIFPNMAGVDNNSGAQSILCSLDETVNRVINDDRVFVDNFTDRLYKSLPRDRGSFTVSFSHGGSAFEGLAVDANADCDITVFIGDPLEIGNFHVERDEVSKYFTLRWKSHVPSKMYADCDGYLDAAKIRSMLFEGLACAIQNLSIPGTVIKSKEGLAAIAVEIERGSGRKLSIDLVPQLVFRSWNQCPDLLPLGKMPKALRKYIDTTNQNKSPTMSFALAVPKKNRYSNGDQLFNISFFLLEKEYFKKNTNVRDMVRLVKFVADRRGWKKDPIDFKSYFAKRVAIKNDEALRSKTLWEGYRTILVSLRDELNETGTIDGYFVGDQVTYKKERHVIESFVKEIDAVLGMSAQEIKALV